ncbi:glutamate receptor ionotropic, kainate 2-like [Diorhabda carinulata]|uniref:glutamate receptor ionotropic, kainate 2-like n=1 Tax=Diorhabda carinulata TaxID=1163345 RepID=UPI00259FEE83|nr:glutamate receptor ionotropic, kainate 2-like [Diorhabda carinulata]
MKNLTWLLLLVVYINLCYCFRRKDYKLGVVVHQTPSDAELPLNDTIIKTNLIEKNSISLTSNIQTISKIDIFETSKIVCNLISDGVVAVFGPPNRITTPVVESTCKSLSIPYIVTSWRKTNTEESNVFLNFHPDADRLAKGIAEIIRSLEWVGFIILYEDEEGLVNLQEVIKLQSVEKTDNQDFIRIEHLVGGPDYRHIFKKFQNSTENNIILDCKTENILPILKQAAQLDMVDIRYNYFLTSLDAHTVDYSSLNLTANLTTIRIFDNNSENLKYTLQKWSNTAFEFYRNAVDIRPDTISTETVLLHDALLYLSTALKDMPNISQEKVNCFGLGEFIDGPAIINATKYVEGLSPVTGPIKFDDYGNRIDFNIYVYTHLDNQAIATYQAQNEMLQLTRTSEETNLASISNLKRIKVIVSTRIGEPYLMYAESPDGTPLQGNDRYEGLTKDLMDEIANILEFQYEIYLTEGNIYGKFIESEKRWTGLIGDLLEGRAHLALCDLTINQQRRSYVDFSMPFMTLGIAIMHKLPAKEEANPFAFLDPFSTAVWIYSATLYLVVSIVLYFIARMTPGDWENPHPCDENPTVLENIWGLKNCHWATLGTIMNQGCDILPKGISSRLALSMWWFFALIITNSYIANLTAFLTKANLEPPIKNVQDLAKQNKIKYGLLEGGATEQFFKESNLSLYQKMYVDMKAQRPSVFEKDNLDGVQRVQNTKNELYAFLMESTGIEYHVQTKCDLKQVGSWLDSKGFGIAMPMNANYRGAIDKAILQLQEAGKLSYLKEKWWKLKRKEPLCENIRSQNKDDNGDLDLARTSGIFLVLTVGVAIAIALGLTEFLWNVRNISVEEHISFWDALKIEVKFAANIWITKKKIKPVVSESTSSESKSEKDNKSMIHSFLQTASSFINLQQSS